VTCPGEPSNGSTGQAEGNAQEIRPEKKLAVEAENRYYREMKIACRQTQTGIKPNAYWHRNTEAQSIA